MVPSVPPSPMPTGLVAPAIVRRSRLLQIPPGRWVPIPWNSSEALTSLSDVHIDWVSDKIVFHHHDDRQASFIGFC